MTMAIIPRPDVYGYTIFCDDIRREIDGKVSFIGVYNRTMIVHVPFPIILPIFGMGVTIFQKKTVFVPKVGLRIFLPGDPDDAPSIQGEAGESKEGVIAAAAAAETDALHPDARGLEEDRYLIMTNELRFTQFPIRQPGVVKVWVAIGNDMMQIGGLRVSPLPQENPHARFTKSGILGQE
jgi:hypothetical protein